MITSKKVILLFGFFAIFIVFVSIACNAGSAAVPGASNAASTPELSQSPKPAVDSQDLALGYLNFSPAVFIPSLSGLKVQISEVTYSPATIGLMSYKLTIADPSGNTSELKFHDIILNPNTGTIDSFIVSTNGKDTQGPSYDEFQGMKAVTDPYVAFSLPHMLGEDLLPIVSLPCAGETNITYGYTEVYRQVLTHKVKCDAQTYNLQFSDYSYNTQYGALAGYSVLTEITP
jgi:hypothetical protein